MTNDHTSTATLASVLQLPELSNSAFGSNSSMQMSSDANLAPAKLRMRSFDGKIESISDPNLPFTSFTSSPILVGVPTPLSAVSSSGTLPALSSNAPFFHSSTMSAARVTPVVVDDHALSSTPFVAPLRTDPSLIYRQPSPVASALQSSLSSSSKTSEFFSPDSASGGLVGDSTASGPNSTPIVDSSNMSVSPFSHAYLGALSDAPGAQNLGSEQSSTAAGLAGIWTSVDSLPFGKIAPSNTSSAYCGALSPPSTSTTPLGFPLMYSTAAGNKTSSPESQGQSPMAPPPQFSDKFLYEGDNDEDDGVQPTAVSSSGSIPWDASSPAFVPPFGKMGPMPAKLDVGDGVNVFNMPELYRNQIFQPLMNANSASSQRLGANMSQFMQQAPAAKAGAPGAGPYIPALGMNLQPSTAVCRFFLQGYCTRGDRCNYTHLPPSVMLSCGGRELLEQLAAAGALGPPPSVRRSGKPAQHAFFTNKAQPNGNMYAKGHKKGAPYLPAAAESGYMDELFASPAEDDGASGLAANFMNMNLVSGKPAANRRNCIEEINRFMGIPLEDLVGQLGFVCRDQDGCRYLQKMLEEENPKHVEIVFNEIFPSFVELMTDPFGNYLCQKLVEYATDDQKTLVVEAVSPNLIDISLNMHGTRAVQKMIEYLTLPQHLRTIALAFSRNVVALIKDLNGNHVIQKCLNRLSPEHDQFIYDAVTENLVEISTHRHGCCVLQRCIDHASDKQRLQLVNEITKHALSLVQDPFANYVVQYIIDLNQAEYSMAIIRKFLGHICALSVQKFSSNVIEKCIRAADQKTRSQYICELNNKEVLERLIRDSFGNYVVQTALDYANPSERQALVDSIRPLLPAIRNTPYGKRFSSKLHRDGGVGIGSPTSSCTGPLPSPNSTSSSQSSHSSSARHYHSGKRMHSVGSDEFNAKQNAMWPAPPTMFKDEVYGSATSPISAWPRLRKV